MGKRLSVRSRSAEPEWMDVIGVVAHQRHQVSLRAGRETVYMPDGEFGFAAANSWVLRTNGDPGNSRRRRRPRWRPSTPSCRSPT